VDPAPAHHHHMALPGCCCCWPQVTLSCELRSPAYDGTQLTGFCYHRQQQQQPAAEGAAGCAPLPPGLEEALCSMTQEETAVFVLPADQMRTAVAAAAAAAAVPAKVAAAARGWCLTLLTRPSRWSCASPSTSWCRCVGSTRRQSSTAGGAPGPPGAAVRQVIQAVSDRLGLAVFQPAAAW